MMKINKIVCMQVPEKMKRVTMGVRAHVRVCVCVRERERDPSVDARKYIFQPYALLMLSKNLYS